MITIGRPSRAVSNVAVPEVTTAASAACTMLYVSSSTIGSAGSDPPNAAREIVARQACAPGR